VVGRSYPPEFYSWIKVPHVRSLFERIAIETEEDFQNIIAKLESFGVEILRPGLSKVEIRESITPPPMTPRDQLVMIGKTLYVDSWWTQFYAQVRDSSWPPYVTLQQFLRHAPDCFCSTQPLTACGLWGHGEAYIEYLLIHHWISRAMRRVRDFKEVFGSPAIG
jgi:hypothetical protein